MALRRLAAASVVRLALPGLLSIFPMLEAEPQAPLKNPCDGKAEPYRTAEWQATRGTPAGRTYSGFSSRFRWASRRLRGLQLFAASLDLTAQLDYCFNVLVCLGGQLRIDQLALFEHRVGHERVNHLAQVRDRNS